VDHLRARHLQTRTGHSGLQNPVGLCDAQGNWVGEKRKGQSLEPPEPAAPGRIRAHPITHIVGEGVKFASEQAYHMVDVSHVFRSFVQAVRFLGNQDLLNNEEAGMGEADGNCLIFLGDSREPCEGD